MFLFSSLQGKSMLLGLKRLGWRLSKLPQRLLHFCSRMLQTTGWTLIGVGSVALLELSSAFWGCSWFVYFHLKRLQWCCKRSKSGSLFVPGCVYHHRSRDMFVLSLGFRKYATVACPLKKVTVGDKDWDYANEIIGCTKKKRQCWFHFWKGVWARNL